MAGEQAGRCNRFFHGRPRTRLVEATTVPGHGPAAAGGGERRAVASPTLRAGVPEVHVGTGRITRMGRVCLCHGLTLDRRPGVHRQAVDGAPADPWHRGAAGFHEYVSGDGPAAGPPSRALPLRRWRLPRRDDPDRCTQRGRHHPRHAGQHRRATLSRAARGDGDQRRLHRWHARTPAQRGLPVAGSGRSQKRGRQGAGVQRWPATGVLARHRHAGRRHPPASASLAATGDALHERSAQYRPSPARCWCATRGKA